TPVIEVSDDYLDEVRITLDGADFTSGTEVIADGGHLLLVQATDLAGSESIQSVAFEIRTGTRPPFHFGVCAFGNVTMLNHAEIMGFDTATGQITDGGDVAAHGGVSLVNNSRLSGEVVAGGNVTLSHNADIYGDVYLAGSVSLAHNSAIHGTVFELDTAPAPCECGYDLDRVLEFRSTHNDNSVLAADPAIAPYLEDGSLHVAHNKQVALPSGVFFFDSIVLENHAGLSLASGAVVELYVAHELIVANNADLSNNPYRAGDLLVVLGTDADAGEELDIRNNVDLGILLYAPRADLVYSNNADLYGGLVIRDLTAENHGQIMVYDSLSTSPPPLVCEGL
ncbi:MAG TPA: collagen-binding domain-containing protein, partial [Myxococcota bacterium]|nr:collagen-binding domain-containing protein [Myxococcota bacterium]